MKKLFPVSLRAFSAAALTFLTGCMATQNRWEATQMRQQVMDYYNDQIMENLIRTKEKLPFVHVDVTSLTTTDAATLAGSVGAGETTNFSRTSPSSTVATALHTITRGVTRPFSYSVSPSRNTSLQIIAAPSLGEVAAPPSSGSPTPTPTPTPSTSPSPPPGFEESKRTTEIEGPNGEKVKIEFTPKATQKPSAITVYTLYEEFVANYDQDSPHVKKHPADSGFRYTEQLASPPDKFIPGTKKRWGSRIYYIVDDENGKFRDAYYRFCKKLLTKGKAQSIDSKIEQAAQTAAQAAEARALAR